MRADRSFGADTQRHCAARRAGEHMPAAQCRCVPVKSNVRAHRSVFCCHSAWKPAVLCYANPASLTGPRSFGPIRRILSSVGS